MNEIQYKHIFLYQFWRFADHLFGTQVPSNRFVNQRKRVSSLVSSNFQEKKVIGTLKMIDRVKNISDYDLKKNYINKGIPVVMEGKAKNWECVKKWSPDWLLENYCDDKVSLFNASAKSITVV